MAWSQIDTPTKSLWEQANQEGSVFIATGENPDIDRNDEEPLVVIDTGAIGTYMQFAFDTTKPGIIRFYEATVIDTLGVTVPLQCQNRGLGTTAIMALADHTTILTDNGTELFEFQVYPETYRFPTPMSYEWILDENDIYMFTFESARRNAKVQWTLRTIESETYDTPSGG